MICAPASVEQPVPIGQAVGGGGKVGALTPLNLARRPLVKENKAHLHLNCSIHLIHQRRVKTRQTCDKLNVLCTDVIGQIGIVLNKQQHVKKAMQPGGRSSIGLGSGKTSQCLVLDRNNSNAYTLQARAALFSILTCRVVCAAPRVTGRTRVGPVARLGGWLMQRKSCFPSQAPHNRAKLSLGGSAQTVSTKRLGGLVKERSACCLQADGPVLLSMTDGSEVVRI